MKTGAMNFQLLISRNAMTVPSSTPVRMARPEAIDKPNKPCATRWPKGVLLLNSASVWIWL